MQAHTHARGHCTHAHPKPWEEDLLSPHMAKAMQGAMGSCAVMGCPDPYTNTAVLSAPTVPVLGTHSF